MYYGRDDIVLKALALVICDPQVGHLEVVGAFFHSRRERDRKASFYNLVRHSNSSANIWVGLDSGPKKTLRLNTLTLSQEPLASPVGKASPCPFKRSKLKTL